MPEILWRHYAGNKVAPLRRQSTGAFMPETKWLHDAESSQGEKKVGDTKAKQYITEGIAGTRDENKKMRGQLLGDMRKRGR